MMSKKIGIVLALIFFLIPAAVDAAPLTHPALLFNDIQNTPGFRYSTVEPWESYQNQILSDADNSLDFDFSASLGSHDRIFYRASYARNLGLAYQITKKPEYAQKAKEALINLDIGTIDAKIDKAEAVGSYSFAYDFIQPTLDKNTDSIIRDKLATLADSAFNDLNDGGKSMDYISFADYHGGAYPNLGIVGAVLEDYSNPSNLPLSSSPEDWHKVGTEYLFVDDKLHSYGRSLFSFGFDEVSGKHLNGAYKSYVVEDYMWWLQVYNHFYHENPFDKFPAAKKAFSSELWESLPNEYSNNYVTNGNTKWVYFDGFMNLFNDSVKSNALNHEEILQNSEILPYSQEMVGPGPADLLYCVYGDYQNIPRSYPITTSHLDNNALYQVFRGSWKPDADWLSIVTWGEYLSNSNRDMLHGDQAAIEYYSRGDLLLADGGEDKYVLNMLYGSYEINHNTIAIENPRDPFPVAGWSDSRSRGVYKGDSHEMVTPVLIQSVLQTSWIEFIDCNENIKRVVGQEFGDSITLSSAILHNRAVLYPDADYFIIIDRFSSAEPWIYDSIFRPTSLTITPTKGSSDEIAESDIGHVNGELSIDNQKFNWQSLPYSTETDTGISSDSITWTTTNPYGKNVEMNLISEPPSRIKITKFVGRIGGYDYRSEVFSPDIWLNTPASQDLSRVTVLLSRYADEEKKTTEKIPVHGSGTAIKVHSSHSDDIIYAGYGNSKFNNYSTDAEIVFIRQNGDSSEITLLDGTFLNYETSPLISVSEKADYVTVMKKGNIIDYKIQGDPDIRGTIFTDPVKPDKIQESASINEQQKPITINSFPELVPGDLFDPISWIKNFAKKIFSFFNA
jgi:hypothetical protein